MRYVYDVTYITEYLRHSTYRRFSERLLTHWRYYSFALNQRYIPVCAWTVCLSVSGRVVSHPHVTLRLTLCALTTVRTRTAAYHRPSYVMVGMIVRMGSTNRTAVSEITAVTVTSPQWQWRHHYHNDVTTITVTVLWRHGDSNHQTTLLFVQ